MGYSLQIQWFCQTVIYLVIVLTETYTAALAAKQKCYTTTTMLELFSKLTAGERQTGLYLTFKTLCQSIQASTETVTITI